MPEVRLLGGPLRERLGDKRVEVADGPVAGVLDELIARGGEALRGMFFEADRETLHRDLRVLVNGRSIQFLAGLETPVGAADTVTLHFSGIRGFPGG